MICKQICCKLIILFSLAININSYGQPLKNSNKTLSEFDDSLGADTANMCILAEEQPQFPGGIITLHDFIRQNLLYPEMAKKNEIEGKVIVSFVVEKDSSLTGIKILKGIGFGCDEEALRIVSLMPKWIPGKINHRVVSAKMALPIKFIKPKE